MKNHEKWLPQGMTPSRMSQSGAGTGDGLENTTVWCGYSTPGLNVKNCKDGQRCQVENWHVPPRPGSPKHFEDFSQRKKWSLPSQKVKWQPFQGRISLNIDLIRIILESTNIYLERPFQWYIEGRNLANRSKTMIVQRLKISTKGPKGVVLSWEVLPQAQGSNLGE